MPTGYTDVLNENPQTSFATFALRCARNFGVCIHMRDTSLDTPPPEELHVDEYHVKALREAEAKARDLEIMTPDDATARAADEYSRQMASWTESKAKTERQRAVYEAMLKKARAWEPPSKEHVGLKKFMIEQLEGSIDFDCMDPERYRPKRLDGPAWLAEQRKRAAWDVNYHREHLDRATKHAREGTEWLRALRASLAPSVTSVTGEEKKT